MIYFQVVDRTLRNFLNDLMLRFPFPAAAGETPPGLTDALIFYDPLVNPTRPGHILPAQFVTLLESGRTAEAEALLIAQILEAAECAAVEHDGEIEMLVIEEEEHRSRMGQIERRRKQLTELCDELSSAKRILKDWKPKTGAAAEAVPSAPARPAAQSPAGPDSEFYVQLVARVRAIMNKNNGALCRDDFDETFRLSIDLGISPSIQDSDARRALSADRPGHPRVLSMSDWLVRKFSEVYQLQKSKEAEEALTASRSSLQDLKGRLARLQQKRRDIFTSSGLSLDAEFERLVQIQRRYFEMESRRRKIQFSLDEKSQFESLKDEIDEIEKKIDSELYLRFSSSSEFLSTFRRLNLAVVQSLQEVIRIQEEERQQQDLLTKLSEGYRHSTPQERWLKMEEQIHQLRQFSKLLAERRRARPFAAVSPPPWPVTPSAVLSVLDRIASQDTTLFPEKFLRRRGPPAVLLVPSFGSGLYDWQDGMLVISMYPDKLETAVQAALGEFRMDADETKELFNSYGSLKRNRNMGFMKLKEMFISDYTTWMEKESAGFRVMETDLRTWFERKIPLKTRE